MSKAMSDIRKLIHDGDISRAISCLNEFIGKYPDDDEAYYLRGNLYRKQGNWQMALNNYLEAMERNPKSPAAQAHGMLMDILEFYNKDMYNQ